MTETFAPITPTVNNSWSMYASTEIKTPSVGILLTAPIRRLKNVTARAHIIKEFSEGSLIGFLNANIIP